MEDKLWALSSVCLISMNSICAFEKHIPNYGTYRCDLLFEMEKHLPTTQNKNSININQPAIHARKIHAKIHFHNLDYSFFKQIKRAKRIKWARISENTNKSNSNISSNRKNNNKIRETKKNREEPKYEQQANPSHAFFATRGFKIRSHTFYSVFRSVTFFIALV